MLRLAFCLLAAGLLLVGCAYPRRTTSLSPVRGDPNTSEVPDDLWAFTVVSAQVTAQQRSGLPWDEGGGRPDPYVRIYRSDELIWESAVRNDTQAPRWNTTLPQNLWVPRDRELRLELWDRDRALSSDPIGIYRYQGLPPTAQADVDANILLEGGSTLVIRVTRPRPHRGVGIRTFEVRGDAIHVVEVIDRSPASRAGIEDGDDIVSIAGRAVGDMDEAAAISALSQAARGGSTLVWEHDGREQRGELDRGYVWLAM